MTASASPESGRASEAGNEESILKKFEVSFYNSFETDFDVLVPDALNTLLDAYNKKVPGAESFICFFKYMQYSFEKNPLQKEEDFEDVERVIKFLTENCSDFGDSIESWCLALLSEYANDISPALLC